MLVILYIKKIDFFLLIDLLLKKKKQDVNYSTD